MPLRVTTPIPIKAPKKPITPSLAAAAPDAITPSSILLGLVWVKQEQSQWCWAACTQMVATYFDVANIKQCQLANFLHQQTSCCVNGKSVQCNRPTPYEGVGLVYNHIGINSVSEKKIIFPAQLLQQLQAKRPVEVGWLWNGGGGHVVLIVGVTNTGLYTVLDPMFGTRILTYQSILHALGMGIWAYSFGVFTKKGN